MDMMDVRDAEQVEEMAEIAAAFLADLGAERILIVHGDENHSNPVTQVFSGLSYDGVESLLFEWSPVAEETLGVYVGERSGRHVLLAPLRDSTGACLGLLYADSIKVFPPEAEESLGRFSRHYLSLLLEICVLRAGALEKPIPADPPQDPPPETDDSWINESWADDEVPTYSQTMALSQALPDLQDYILLDWYR